MNENEPRPSDNPYGSEPRTNPYGQPLPSSPEQSAAEGSAGREGGGSTAYPPPAYGEGSQEHGQGSPYGQVPPPQGQAPHPYGQAPQPYGQAPQPYGQAPQPYGESQQPYGQAPHPYGQSQQPPYGSSPYGVAYDTRGNVRPGTVSAAGWTTVVLGVLGALLYLGLALMAFLGQDYFADEFRSEPGVSDSGMSADAAVVLVGAVCIVFAVWGLINVLLGALVLRRSNVARILLIVSCAVLALLSLVLLPATAFSSLISLLASVIVIVLLFVGGASDWFARKGQPAHGGPGQDPSYGGGSPYDQR